MINYMFGRHFHEQQFSHAMRIFAVLQLYQLSKRILGGGITRQLLKVSLIGGQFLGGFSEEEARDVAQLLASRKLCSKNVSE